MAESATEIDLDSVIDRLLEGELACLLCLKTDEKDVGGWARCYAGRWKVHSVRLFLGFALLLHHFGVSRLMSHR